MKFSDYLIIFIFIFAAFGIIAFYGINTESKAGIASNEYSAKLTAACEDAIKTINTENIEKNSLWGEVSERTKTLDTFYTTLRMGFNVKNTNQDNELKVYIPVVCLIDLDGYYISYNSAFDDSGQIVRLASDEDSYAEDSQTMTVSPLNTWTDSVDGYIVRFFLNDYIEITKGTVTYAGKRPEVLKKVSKAETNSIDTLKKLLSQDDYYDIYRSELITDEINKNIEYYINQQNVMAKALDISYDYDIPYFKYKDGEKIEVDSSTGEYTLPKVEAEDWHRALQRPTVISFLQGIQMRTREEFVNVYSLAGGELIKQQNYFIEEEIDESTGKVKVDSDGNPIRRYHILEEGICDEVTVEKKIERHRISVNVTTASDLTNPESEEYKDVIWTCNGERITNIYSSMEDCAIRGAYPCSCCKNLNI